MCAYSVLPSWHLQAKENCIATADKYGLEVDKTTFDSADALAQTAMRTFVEGLCMHSFAGASEKVELRRQVMSHLALLKPYRLTKTCMPGSLKVAIDKAQKYAYLS